MSLPPVPEHFTCPITLDVMNDPVIATKSGVTYDRTALLQSLEIKPECPSTRLPMTSDDLIPNLALKSMIEAWQNPRQTEQLKLEVLTLDCVKTSEMESDSDSDNCESNSSENVINKIVQDKCIQKKYIHKPGKLKNPLTVPKFTMTLINPHLTQLPHGVPSINKHTRNSLMRSLQHDIHKNIVIRDFSKSRAHDGKNSKFMEPPYAHAYSCHLARQMEYQLVRKPRYASMTQRNLREIKISNNKHLESLVVKNFEASFSDSDRIQMFQLTGYEVPARITNKRLGKYFQKNKVISPEKKVVCENENVEQQLKKQILSSGFENRRVGHNVGNDHKDRVRLKSFNKVSKNVAKVPMNDYDKPLGGRGRSPEKKELVQPGPTKKPLFLTTNAERDSHAENQMKNPKISVLRSPILKISSTKSLDSDEKIAIKDIWSKNFVIPALQSMYSEKAIDKPNFKKLAKYLTDLCANNLDLACGNKTKNFIEIYVKHFMDKTKVKGFISESTLAQLKRSLTGKLVDKDEKQ